MDTNRHSAHHSQNEDNFPTFSLGLEFLNEAEKEKNDGKRILGISAVTIRFTVRG